MLSFTKFMLPHKYLIILSTIWPKHVLKIEFLILFNSKFLAESFFSLMGLQYQLTVSTTMETGQIFTFSGQ